MTRRLLITGGAGFIGANFAHYWSREHQADDIVVLDLLTYAGNRQSLAGLMSRDNFWFVHGDICDRALVESVLREREIDTVVHFAAESHVDRSIHGPAEFMRTNVEGTFALLEAAREVWLHGSGLEHRFHHVSTDEVYGTLLPDDPPFSETTAYAPNSPYASSKAASDHLVRAWHHTYGLQVTTSNCSNNYGPYHFPEKLIPLLIVNALGGKSLPVYGDGSNIRDWLYVEDHCRGIDLVLESGRVGQTYNIGGNNERRNLDLVHALCDRLDAAFSADVSLAKRFPDAPPAKGEPTRSLVSFVKDRPGHDWRYAIDATRARDELGFVPSVDLDRGLDLTISWYLDHEDWWRSVLDGSYRDWINRQYGSR